MTEPSVVLMCTKEEIGYWLDRKCICCSGETYFALSWRQYERYIIKGEHAQDVFSHIPANIRETIISGTHSDCFDQLYADFEEDD